LNNINSATENKYYKYPLHLSEIESPSVGLKRYLLFPHLTPPLLLKEANLACIDALPSYMSAD